LIREGGKHETEGTATVKEKKPHLWGPPGGADVGVDRKTGPRKSRLKTQSQAQCGKKLDNGNNGEKHA